MIRRAIVLFLAAAALSACEESVAPDRGTPGIAVINSPSVEDTALAQFSQRLVLQWSDPDGVVRPNVPFRFTPVLLDRQLVSGEVRPDLPSVTFGLGNAAPTQTELDALTDAEGRITLRVRLGDVTGTGGIIVAVGGVVRDTIVFTITPGNAVAIRSAPADTSARVGAAYELRAGVVDQNDNIRPETVVRTVAGAGVALNGTQVQAGAVPARGRIALTGAGLTDTAFVSVVPDMSMAAVAVDARGHTLVTVGLDGSGYTEHFTHPSITMNLAWSPDGQQLAVTAGGLLRLMVPGSAPTLLPIQPQLQNIRTPDWAPDGSGIFLSAASGAEQQAIWFHHLAGDSTRRITSPVGSAHEWPSASPDGARISFINRLGSTTGLNVAQVSDGSEVQVGVPATMARWSPDGQWIAAIVNQRVVVMRPDGSEQRIITPPGRVYAPPSFGGDESLDWTPDSQYVIAGWREIGGERGLELIGVNSGVLLPLAWSTQLQGSVIRP